MDCAGKYHTHHFLSFLNSYVNHNAALIFVNLSSMYSFREMNR